MKKPKRKKNNPHLFKKATIFSHWHSIYPQSTQSFMKSSRNSHFLLTLKSCGSWNLSENPKAKAFSYSTKSTKFRNGRI